MLDPTMRIRHLEALKNLTMSMKTENWRIAGDKCIVYKNMWTPDKNKTRVIYRPFVISHQTRVMKLNVSRYHKKRTIQMKHSKHFCKVWGWGFDEIIWKIINRNDRVPVYLEYLRRYQGWILHPTSKWVGSLNIPIYSLNVLFLSEIWSIVTVTQPKMLKKSCSSKLLLNVSPLN